MSEKDRIAQIQRRFDATTKGPWSVARCEGEAGHIDYDIESYHGSARRLGTKIACGVERRPDADFIAMSRDDVAFLLDLIAAKAHE